MTGVVHRGSGHGYRPLDERSVLDVAAPHLPEAPLAAVEVGDGNLNLVFRVSSASSSVIVKQALPYLRVAGDSWPLTRDRARIEAGALEVHGKLAPGLLPQLLHFDPVLSALVLEDLREHVTWRQALVDGRSVEGVAQAVADYSAAVIMGTSDVLLRSRERKLLRQRFGYSELCLVTEDLVFTAPYTEAASNRYDAHLAPFVAHLHRDRALQAAAAELRFAFKTTDEALIHGDLHTGSLMVMPGDVRVIDLEFAFFGPFGFDPGVLLGNLALSRLAHEAAGSTSFARVVDEYARDYWAALVDGISRRWDPAEPWYHRFLSQFLSAAGRFAGMEMVRRVVGLAHAKDLDVLPDTPRLRAQTCALSGGRALMVRPPVRTFDELWDLATGEEFLS